MIFEIDLGLVSTVNRKVATQCLVQKAVNLIQQQAKKTVALTMSARRIKKVGEYARQIGFPLMEILENRKLRCGYPIQFFLNSFGVFGHWAETGKKCPQPVLVIFDSIFHLPAETGKKALQTAPVGFKIILYLIQHQSSS